MTRNGKKGKQAKLIKIICFDEVAAQDYIDIVNGGRLDWSTDENKQKVAKMLVEIEAQAQGGFNVLSFLKASLTGHANASAAGDISKIFDSTLKNTLLTDYITEASSDDNVRKFEPDGVYAPDNSVSMYKMYSSYLTVVPKDQLPIDMEKLNDALLGERGYYAMLLLSEIEPTCVLRFNITSFKNNYNLADLSKMKLIFYGVKVGVCKYEQLAIEKEFEIKPLKSNINPEDILDGDRPQEVSYNELGVYDIVLAGVACE